MAADDEGHTYANTFSSPGVYRYICNPPQSLGMKGVVFAALGQPGSPT